MKFIPQNEEKEFLDERALTLTGILYRKFGRELKEVRHDKCVNLSEGTVTYEYEAKVSGGGFIWHLDDLDSLGVPVGFKHTVVGARGDVLELYFKDVRYAPMETKRMIAKEQSAIRRITKRKGAKQ